MRLPNATRLIRVSEIVDTNVLVRLLTQDDPTKATRCLELFQQANRGESNLATSEAVIAETVYVLASRRLYGLPRDELAVRLGAVLAGSRLRLDHKDAVLEALQLYGSTHLHFVDCLCVAHARQEAFPHIVYSYDQDLDRIAGIRRLEP
jgi:predicted nucleic-acid-binding protein